MTFANVYEMVSPPATVKKSWFVEYFDGDDLKAYWTQRNVVGSGTFAMDDVVDGGFKINATTTSAVLAIDFNGIRHYEPTGCVVIGIIACDAVISMQSQVGLVETTAYAVNDDFILAGSRSFDSTTNFIGRTGNSTGETFITLAAIDTNFHRYQMELTSSNATFKMDGILEGTKTDKLPNTRLFPAYFVHATTATDVAGRIRYYEAYNT